MWFFTEFLERYTRNIARSFLRIAAVEVDANRQVVSGIGLTRDGKNGLVMPDRSLCVPPTIVAEPRAVLASGLVPEDLVVAAAALEAERAAALVTADEAMVARTIAGLDAMPPGVRGAVVFRYIDAFAAAPSRDAAALIEKLRKDKKVRVAELQLIAAEVLADEVVIRRKKAEHLDVLRRHLIPSVDRRVTVSVPNVMHIN